MGSTTTSPISTVVSPSQGTVSTSQFARGVLVGLKAPVTNNNIANVQRWLGLEQGSSAANWAQNQTNPLGVGTGGSVHPFTTPYEGIVATVNTLLGSSSYQPIVSSLQNNAPAPVFAQALVAAPWQSGQSGGTTYSGQTAAQIAAMDPFVVGSNPGVANPTGLFGQYGEPALNFAAKNLPGAGVVYQATGGVTNVVKGVGGAVSSVSSVGGFIGKITNPTNLKNVGIFMGGMALTIVGLVILMQSSKQVRMAEGTAVKAAAA